MTLNLILFEDVQVSDLAPVCLARPAFAITCGTYRLIDLLECRAGAISYVVRPHLRAVVAADFPPIRPMADGPLLAVNAALVPDVHAIEAVVRLADAGRPGIVRVGGRCAAAVIDPGRVPDARQLHFERFDRYLSELPPEPLESALELFQHPHDVIRHHLRIMRASLEHRLGRGGFSETEPGVFLAEGARLGTYVVADTSDGPIVLDAGASVGPHCYLKGPVYLGARTRVIEHAAIKDRVTLGHTTKIGGEVEGSIIEAYTNKQHHGFLGHSYLGSWINLGAGTCNSDLKNTYGEVSLDYDGQKVRTGMQFLGCVMGDYSKTAVNTSIFTGKVIGVGSMIYGFVTTNVPSFVNYARTFGQVTEIPVDVLIATQERMFARRDVVQRPCDTQLLQDMHAMTRHERQLAGEPLSL